MVRRRVPEIVQMSVVECGAACLAMILGYYGRKTSISEISEEYGASRDGLSAWHIAQAARDYGLKVRAISSQSSDLRDIPCPAIIHWQFNHFLVVERWTPRFIDVVDPAAGKKRLTPQEFDAGFTGILLLFESGGPLRARKAASGISLHAYLEQFVRLVPLAFLQIFLVSVFLQACGLLMPLLTKTVVDQIIPNHMFHVLGLLAGGLLLILSAQLVMTLLRTLLLTYLQGRIDISMTTRFFEHLLTLPLRFFQQRPSGDILTRVASNTAIRDLISNQLISTIIDSGMVLTYLLILLSQSLLLSITVLGVGLLQLAILFVTLTPVQRLTSRELEAMGISQGYVTEMLAGITTLKAAGAEQRAFQRWYNLFLHHLNASLRLNYTTSFINVCVNMLNVFAPVFLLIIGIHEVLYGKMQVGTMLALNVLASEFLGPLTSLVSSGRGLQAIRSHIARLADVIDTHSEQDVQQVRTPPRLTGQITLKQVSFRYHPTDPEILKDITISIEAGQKIALVGRTGAGKSTLGKLLLGLLLPTEGVIAYDGIPLSTLHYQAVRAQFGSVMQDTHIFSGSIRQNITLNHPDIDMEKITRATQIAELHDDILQMPLGYETSVGEGGSALSGGQCQRLALARALVHNPAILLLDEATNSLDVLTERRVEENLRSLQCTQIIIAHRLSTVRSADCILVLNAGRIVESGTHDELLQQQGYYAQLIQNQLAHGTIPAGDFLSE